MLGETLTASQYSDINFDTGVVAMSEFDSTRPKRVGAPKMGCSRSTPQGVPRRPAVAQSRRPSVLTRSAPSTMLRGNLYTGVRHEGKLSACSTEW